MLKVYTQLIIWLQRKSILKNTLPGCAPTSHSVLKSAVSTAPYCIYCRYKNGWCHLWATARTLLLDYQVYCRCQSSYENVSFHKYDNVG